MPKIDPNTLTLESRTVRTNKVQKTTKGGRTLSWSILIVVGDGQGHVGVGIGKARSIPDAVRKGEEDAKKNLVLVPMVNGTIPHQILAEHGASEVLLRPAAPGTGVVAGGAVRVMLESAGLRDVLAKSIGSNNPVNNAWATMVALRSLRSVEETARLRGKTVGEIWRGAAGIATAAGSTPDNDAAAAVNPVAVAATSENQSADGAASGNAMNVEGTANVTS